MTFLDSYSVKAYLNSSWTDITSDVIEIMGGSWGISGNSATDLLADTGEMYFTLNDIDNQYVPGLATSLSGWDKNTPILFTAVYEGESIIRFRGYVDILT